MPQTAGQTYDDGYARDRAEIEDLMARYLFALDYNDFDRFIDCFAEGAEFEYARGRVAGKDAILETVKAFKEAIGKRYVIADGSPATLRHVLGQTVVEVHGDMAWTRAFWFEMANDGPDNSLKMGTFGVYEDKLARVDGRWLFTERRILNEFLPGRESGPGNPVATIGN